MFKLFATTLALTSYGATADECKFLQPYKNGDYLMHVDLSPADCQLLKINMVRHMFLYYQNYVDDAATAGMGDHYTSICDMADPDCPATAGNGLMGGGCPTWTVANDTHPLCLSGKIPASHVMVMNCIHNHGSIARQLAAIDKALAESKSEQVKWGAAIMRHYLEVVITYCIPMVGPYSESAGSGGMPCQVGDPDAGKVADFGGLPLSCCEAAHVNLASVIHASHPDMTGYAPLCPAHGDKYGGCVGTTSKPTPLALGTALAKIRENDCACGNHMYGNLTTTAFKTVLDADGDTIPDACTTAAPTTAAPAADSDSSAFGVTVSISAALVSILASFL